MKEEQKFMRGNQFEDVANISECRCRNVILIATGYQDVNTGEFKFINDDIGNIEMRPDNGCLKLIGITADCLISLAKENLSHIEFSEFGDIGVCPRGEQNHTYYFRYESDNEEFYLKMAKVIGWIKDKD